MILMLFGYYIKEKYPFGETEVTLEEIKENLKVIKDLIDLIKKDFE